MPNKKEIRVIEEAFPVNEDDAFIDIKEIASQISPEERVSSFIEWHKKMRIHD